MLKMSKLPGLSIALVLALGGCHHVGAQLNAGGGPHMTASFSEMSDSSFRLTVTAPRDAVVAYAVCKATWFADNMDAQRLSLGDPDHSVLLDEPPNWRTVSGIIYLDDEPNPDGNDVAAVRDLVPECREWDWYR